jgi:hypothetical protein
MKKSILFLVALCTVVAANAFELKLNNSSLSKSVTFTTATDNSDVFGDGKVSVKFRTDDKLIDVYLRNEALLNTTDDMEPAFKFVGDDDYEWVRLNVSGTVTIKTTGNYANAIELENGILETESQDYAAVLDIKTNNIAILMKYKSIVYLGVGGDPITVNIRSNNDKGMDAMIVGLYDKTHALRIERANVNFINPNSIPLTDGLTELKANLAIFSEDVEIKNNKFYWKGTSSECKDNLVLYAPYAIKIGDEYFYGDKKTPAALKKGTLSYNPATRTLTMNNAEIDGPVTSYLKDFTLYLAGSNSIKNSAEDTYPRIDFQMPNARIIGAEDAYLNIYCRDKCDGIFADEGLEISYLRDLSIYGSRYGILATPGADEANNVLKIYSPIEIYASSNPIKDFASLTIGTGMEFSNPDLEYDKTEQRLVDTTDPLHDPAHCNIYYPSYFQFYDNPVNFKNADNLVPAADGKASYDKATNTLTLNNFKYEGYDPSNAIYLNDIDLKIVLQGENTITGSIEAIAVYNDHKITIEGPGKLNVTSTNSYGINMSTESSLTICKGADVTVNGWGGIHGDAMVMCTGGGWDPETMTELPSEISGNAATLIIDNASVKVNASDSYMGGITGIEHFTLTNAKITAPEGAYFEFGCNSGGGVDAIAGIVAGGAYAQDITISKQATAVENVQTDNAQCTKVLRDGQLYLMYNGQLYNVQGTLMK